jgi:hypothetical protein
MAVKLTNVCLALLLMIGAGVSPAAERYERSVKIAPVRLSHADLMRLVGTLRSLTDTANNGAKTELPGSETLDLSGGDLTLSLETGFSLSDLRRAPATSSSVRYSFTRLNAPIARVDLELLDFERTLRVQGAAPDQVDAMVAAFALQIAESTTMFGGLSFRSWAGALLWIFGFILINVPLLDRLAARRSIFWFVGGAVLLSVWFAPWSTWFPGTAVYPTEASFIVRNAASISFFGALLTIAGLVLTIMSSVRTERRGTGGLTGDDAEASPRPAQPDENPRDNLPQQPPQA